MSTNTMSFALPEVLRQYIDERVKTGPYGNTSEYLRDLIQEGLESGPGRELTRADWAELRKTALARKR
jgi:antitoxin ParD1/3/4